MKQVYCLIILMLISSPNELQSQSPPQPQQRPGDPAGQFMFPPELVMQNQRAIGITDQQRTYITQQIQTAQSQFTGIQWTLQDAMQTMQGLMQQDKIDEQQVLTQLEKVLDLERQIKRAQMTLLIRIKNNLTPEQQAQLRQIRQRRPQVPRPPG